MQTRACNINTGVPQGAHRLDLLREAAAIPIDTVLALRQTEYDLSAAATDGPLKNSTAVLSLKQSLSILVWYVLS